MITIKDPAGLKDLLLEVCPPDKYGRQSIPRLAGLLGMSAFGVYKWINSGRMSPAGANLLIDFTESRKDVRSLTREDLSPYVFGPTRH